MMKVHEEKATGKGFLVGLEPPPDTLLDSPLDYILADHFRQRCLCARLRGMAEDGTSTSDVAKPIVSYLKKDLPRHHEDEDRDIYPVLLRRARSEDEIEGILERLALDHRQTEDQAGAIIEALTAPHDADLIVLDPNTTNLMRAFAATEHRHLAIENGIVLVIARRRLRPQDISKISSTMKSRRGLGS
ncbi:MAG: hemerythrin domain-containing protein [Hyphomicrobiaceae bacterium]